MDFSDWVGCCACFFAPENSPGGGGGNYGGWRINDPPWRLIDRRKKKRNESKLGEPLRRRYRLWNPSVAARWQWRNFPPLWGTFFSYQAPRGPRKKTLSSSSYTPKRFSGRWGELQCVSLYACMWGIRHLHWSLRQVSCHVSAHAREVFIVESSCSWQLS